MGKSQKEEKYKKIHFAISQLYDILSKILSGLPVNDAIRTSVLSRKWKYVWCSHTNLTLNKGTMRKPYVLTLTPYRWRWLRDYEFITRVDAVLRQHSGMGVQRMEIKFRLHSKHADHIDRWVNFVIASKTKELVINLSGHDKGSFFTELSQGIRIIKEPPYNLPSQLLSPSYGSYLRCLELTTVSLQLPADFKGFLNLKILSLVDMSITDEDVQCMLSKCNLLEFLDISYCRMVTSIRMLHPLDRLKHLVVDNCRNLKEIELNCSPTTLKFSGTMVPLIFASTSRLTNINIVFITYQSALSYIITGFPSTLPRLETLTLHCAERERTIVPEGPFKFTYLRNLRLELVLSGHENTRKTNVLDYAYILEIAPFMETLELSMWAMNCRHRPYREEDGELRIVGPPHQHAHLKSVRISGFFGHKDQVELALHILRSSVVLEKMVITPKPEIDNDMAFLDCSHEKKHYLDGHRVATEFVCKTDHRNVVTVERVVPEPADGEVARKRRRAN
uniref:OO_Ba0005L10-OO_Ba0081K17.27 protein n=1 Tax=Oryza officinalis TaxID=4535 RepID=D0ABD8_9ORYZ|nr:OO_Ba0005L10-OO_Ba0081K17.27 [Oryza officinalis]